MLITARRAIAAVSLVLLACCLAFAGWYWFSPHRALAAFADRTKTDREIARLYDRARLRGAFAQQMVRQVDSYPAPFTKAVILQILTNPRTVRALVIEPYGEWQFAAAEGLPPDLVIDDGPAGSMPRLLETTGDWAIAYEGLDAFVARGSDRPDDLSHAYRFERSGVGWTLVAIELNEPVR